MNLGQRIKQLREEQGLSQKELATRVGYSSPSTVAKIETDRNDVPLSRIDSIAQVLCTTAEYLMGYSDDPYDYERDIDNRLDDIPGAVYSHLVDIYGDDLAAIWHAYAGMESDAQREAQKAATRSDVFPVEYNPTHRIPILGRISAGIPLYAEQNVEGYTYTDLNHGAEYFALRVQGDSMNAARICDGDLLIVRRQSVVEDGEIAVVMVGEDEATVKIWHLQHGMVMLEPKSTNPVHKMQFYDPRNTQIKVIGKVVKVEIRM